MADITRRSLEGAAVTGTLALGFRFPLAFTGLLLFSGVFGGLVVGPRLTQYESPLYHGAVVGALGAVPYAAVRLALGAAVGILGLLPALAEVASAFVFFPVGGVAGALLGKRFLADDAGAEEATAD